MYGLEHLEVVVGKEHHDPCNLNKEVLLDFMKQYPDVSFDMKAFDKDCNPDVCLQVLDYSVKFHVCPLYKVILLYQSTLFMHQ
jgi:hypothetical protein